MAHETEMINEMKETIMEMLTTHMQWGWSLEQIEPLFTKASQQALEALKTNN